MAHQRRGERIAEHEGRHEHGLQRAQRIAEEGLVAGSRQPAELHRNQQDQHDAEPEIRDRQAGQRDDVGEIVEDRVLLDRRQDAHRHADREGEDHRHDGELDGDRQLFGDQLQNRLVGAQRDAEIALERRSPASRTY